MKQNVWQFLWLAVLIGSLVGGGAFILQGFLKPSHVEIHDMRLPVTFSDAVRRASPAVVNILLFDDT